MKPLRGRLSLQVTCRHLRNILTKVAEAIALPAATAEGGTAASKDPADEGKKRRWSGKEGDNTHTGNAWTAAKRKRMTSASSSALSRAPLLFYCHMCGILDINLLFFLRSKRSSKARGVCQGVSSVSGISLH